MLLALVVEPLTTKASNKWVRVKAGSAQLLHGCIAVRHCVSCVWLITSRKNHRRQTEKINTCTITPRGSVCSRGHLGVHACTARMPRSKMIVRGGPVVWATTDSGSRRALTIFFDGKKTLREVNVLSAHSGLLFSGTLHSLPSVRDVPTGNIQNETKNATTIASEICGACVPWLSSVTDGSDVRPISTRVAEATFMLDGWHLYTSAAAVFPSVRYCCFSGVAILY